MGSWDITRKPTTFSDVRQSLYSLPSPCHAGMWTVTELRRPLLTRCCEVCLSQLSLLRPLCLCVPLPGHIVVPSPRTPCRGGGVERGSTPWDNSTFQGLDKHFPALGLGSLRKWFGLVIPVLLAANDRHHITQLSITPFPSPSIKHSMFVFAWRVPGLQRKTPQKDIQGIWNLWCNTHVALVAIENMDLIRW